MTGLATSSRRPRSRRETGCRSTTSPQREGYRGRRLRSAARKKKEAIEGRRVAYTGRLKPIARCWSEAHGAGSRPANAGLSSKTPSKEKGRGAVSVKRAAPAPARSALSRNAAASAIAAKNSKGKSLRRRALRRMTHPFDEEARSWSTPSRLIVTRRPNGAPSEAVPAKSTRPVASQRVATSRRTRARRSSKPPSS